MAVVETALEYRNVTGYSVEEGHGFATVPYGHSSRVE